MSLLTDEKSGTAQRMSNRSEAWKLHQSLRDHSRYRRGGMSWLQPFLFLHETLFAADNCVRLRPHVRADQPIRNRSALGRFWRQRFLAEVATGLQHFRQIFHVVLLSTDLILSAVW